MVSCILLVRILMGKIEEETDESRRYRELLKIRVLENE
jgi:hypothetical protein